MSRPIPRTVVLSNGVEMPRVGLGTFRVRGQEAAQAVTAALNAGTRHIDTASIYKNEAEIGEAIRMSGVPREDVFVTSKVSPYEQGEAGASAAVDAILNRLGMEYVDLLLVHWPGVARAKREGPENAAARLGTWRVLERCYEEGRCRAIGVSNYTQGHLKELLGVSKVAPAVNQIEVHPRCQQRELREFCAQNHVAVVAYASLGSGELLCERHVQDAAAASETTPARALLLWGLHHGCCVIPKSGDPTRIAAASEPALLGGAGLSQASLAQLDGMEELLGRKKICWDPEGIA
ncbi:unnamed protein product [Pedinophyceae sp. YPF-701]|nr:unnamed protein product [Pedinophyceae sp. YPF-701]